jgi:hypothetical protein
MLAADALFHKSKSNAYHDFHDGSVFSCYADDLIMLLWMFPDGVGSLVPRLLYQISYALRACRVLCSIPAASARGQQELQKSHLESRRKQGDGLLEIK